MTFGRVPITAFAKLAKVVDGEERLIGREAAETICAALVGQKILDVDGRIQPAFNPKRKGFKLDLPEAHRELLPPVIDLLSSYQIERHIRRERDDRPNKLKKEVILSPEFIALWDRIKPTRCAVVKSISKHLGTLRRSRIGGRGLRRMNRRAG
ncbi:MAG: hypothetical protein ACREV4_12835 [Gammaproteobacteria bacterium]